MSTQQNTPQNPVQSTLPSPHRPVAYTDMLRAQIDELEWHLSGSSGPHPHGSIEQMQKDLAECREELAHMAKRA